ncbi:type IV toxin-antitoxin system AbiEi family antitoxin domain-containing protein [Pseudofrankia asymbiotica]|nr:type IV toxin-antitoxin system AbiEi family antitoxin domain-containing protein [Pseudofrankia asymbiotica]
MTTDRAQRGHAVQNETSFVDISSTGEVRTPADGPLPAPRAGGTADEPVAGLAAGRAGVLTVKEALAAGLTRAEIRRRVDSGWWQLYPGDVVVTQPGPLTLIQRLWCALVSIGPDALLGGSSAAALGGLRGCEEPWLTVLLASGRRVTPRPGVRIRATARLGDEDLHLDSWPPRTALPRSVVDMAEWAPSHDEARRILALGVASGIVESDEVRSALARRGPISRRQVISDALDDLDADAPWVPDLLHQRIEERFGLPPGRRVRPDSRGAGRLDIHYEPWRVHVELGMIAATGIRTAAVPPAPSTVPGSRGGRVARSVPAGIQMVAHPGQTGRWAGHLVVRVPIRILREEPDRVGAAVASALRQRGWTGAHSRLTRGTSGRAPASATTLDQTFGPALGVDLAGLGPFADSAAVPRAWA